VRVWTTAEAEREPARGGRDQEEWSGRRVVMLGKGASAAPGHNFPIKGPLGESEGAVLETYRPTMGTYRRCFLNSHGGTGLGALHAPMSCPPRLDAENGVPFFRPCRVTYEYSSSSEGTAEHLEDIPLSIGKQHRGGHPGHKALCGQPLCQTRRGRQSYISLVSIIAVRCPAADNGDRHRASLRVNTNDDMRHTNSPRLKGRVRGPCPGAGARGGDRCAVRPGGLHLEGHRNAIGRAPVRILDVASTSATWPGKMLAGKRCTVK
jgi:hypothetical protein